MYKSEDIPSSCVTLGSIVTKKTMLVLVFYMRYTYSVVFLDDFSPWRFICRWPIIVLMELSKSLLIKLSVRPGHVVRKTSFLELSRLVFVEINSAE